MARQQAEDTPDRCAECGAVGGDMVKRHGRHVCPECAQWDEIREDGEPVDVVAAMALMGGSRTWA